MPTMSTLTDDDRLDILGRAADYGLRVGGGDCAEVAIAINRLLFGGKGRYVAAVNSFLWSSGTLVGHVGVQDEHGVIWDADGTYDDEDAREEFRAWGMLDWEDPDYGLPNEDAGYEAEIVDLSAYIVDPEAYLREVMPLCGTVDPHEALAEAIKDFEYLRSRGETRGVTSSEERLPTNDRPVFFYGTLRRGQENHHRLGTPGIDATFLREASIPGWRRLLLGPDESPNIVPVEGASTKGELYTVSPATLTALDAYEGPDWVRGLVTLDDGTKAYAYTHWMWEHIGDAVEKLPIGGTYVFKTVCPRCGDDKKRIKTTARLTSPGVVELSAAKCHKCQWRLAAELAHDHPVRPESTESLPAGPQAQRITDRVYQWIYRDSRADGHTEPARFFHLHGSLPLDFQATFVLLQRPGMMNVLLDVVQEALDRGETFESSR